MAYITQPPAWPTPYHKAGFRIGALADEIGKMIKRVEHEHVSAPRDQVVDEQIENLLEELRFRHTAMDQIAKERETAAEIEHSAFDDALSEVDWRRDVALEGAVR